MFLFGLSPIVFTAIYNIVCLLYKRNFSEVLEGLVGSIFLAIGMSFVATIFLRLEILTEETDVRKFIANAEASINGVWTTPARLSLLACAVIGATLLLFHIVAAILFGTPWQLTTTILTLTVSFVLSLPIWYIVTKRLYRNVKQLLQEVKTLSGE